MVTHFVEDFGIACRLGRSYVLGSRGHIDEVKLRKDLFSASKRLTLALIILVLFAALIGHRRIKVVIVFIARLLLAEESILRLGRQWRFLLFWLIREVLVGFLRKIRLVSLQWLLLEILNFLHIYSSLFRMIDLNRTII